MFVVLVVLAVFVGVAVAAVVIVVVVVAITIRDGEQRYHKRRNAQLQHQKRHCRRTGRNSWIFLSSLKLIHNHGYGVGVVAAVVATMVLAVMAISGKSFVV